MSGVRSWTGPALDRPPRTRSSEVQVQVHYISGPDMEVQVQVRQKCPGPGPDRTSDSLISQSQVLISPNFLLNLGFPRVNKLALVAQISNINRMKMESRSLYRSTMRLVSFFGGVAWYSHSAVSIAQGIGTRVPSILISAVCYDRRQRLHAAAFTVKYAGLTKRSLSHSLLNYHGRFYTPLLCYPPSAPSGDCSAVITTYKNGTWRHNLKLAVKNTGHDYLGRSTARDGSLIWGAYICWFILIGSDMRELKSSVTCFLCDQILTQ